MQSLSLTIRTWFVVILGSVIGSVSCAAADTDRIVGQWHGSRLLRQIGPADVTWAFNRDGTFFVKATRSTPDRSSLQGAGGNYLLGGARITFIVTSPPIRAATYSYKIDGDTLVLGAEPRGVIRLHKRSWIRSI
jgi:hypothetical protein